MDEEEEKTNNTRFPLVLFDILVRLMLLLSLILSFYSPQFSLKFIVVCIFCLAYFYSFCVTTRANIVIGMRRYVSFIARSMSVSYVVAIDGKRTRWKF